MNKNGDKIKINKYKTNEHAKMKRKKKKENA